MRNFVSVKVSFLQWILHEWNFIWNSIFDIVMSRVHSLMLNMQIFLTKKRAIHRMMKFFPYFHLKNNLILNLHFQSKFIWIHWRFLSFRIFFKDTHKLIFSHQIKYSSVRFLFFSHFISFHYIFPLKKS